MRSYVFKVEGYILFALSNTNKILGLGKYGFYVEK